LWLEGKSLVKASILKSQPSDPPVDEAEIPLLIERLDDSSPSVPLDVKEKYPLSRSMKYLDHNFVTPEVHFAYSVTWLLVPPSPLTTYRFSLSIAAIVIARYASKSKRRFSLPKR
jgi:hypothetical protein